MSYARSSLEKEVRELTPFIRSLSTRIEKERELPAELVEKLASLGVFNMLVPKAFGGLESDPHTYMDVVSALAEADGSVGWCTMIWASTNYSITAYLEPDAVTEIMGGDRKMKTAGTPTNITGIAKPVDGGFTLTGRWKFGSGISHSSWVIGGVYVDQPYAEGEPPEIRVMAFPRAQCEIIDTWNTSGLRGSGSHDFAVKDIFVPRNRTCLRDATPIAPGTLFRMAAPHLFGQAAQALGVARHAIDTVIELGKTKSLRPAGLLRDRASARLLVADAEALVGSAEAYLHEMARRLWNAAAEGREPDRPDRARFWIALRNAVHGSLKATEWMYQVAGGTAVYTDCPLDQCMRDLHAVAQHAIVGPYLHECAGAALLGADTGERGF